MVIFHRKTFTRGSPSTRGPGIEAQTLQGVARNPEAMQGWLQLRAAVSWSAIVIDDGLLVGGLEQLYGI